MSEKFVFQEAPAGLSNMGRYIFYKCQMEMYRKSLGLSVEEQPNKARTGRLLLSAFLGIPVGVIVYLLAYSA